jgi:hypothetical protein
MSLLRPALVTLLLAGSSFGALSPLSFEPATVQPVTPEDRKPSLSTPSPTRETRTVLNLYADHAFATNFTDSAGELAVTRAGAECLLAIPVFDKAQLTFDVVADRWNFNFKNATTLDAADGEPWSDATDLNAAVTFANKIDDRWSYVTGGFVRSAFADGASVGDSITGGGLVGVTYKFSHRFSLGGGLIASTVLEDNVRVIPIITLDWRISDHWSLRTNPGVGRRMLALAYAPTEELTISLGTGAEWVDIRLDDESPAPKGVGRFKRVPLGLEATYDFSKHVSANVYCGYLLGQQITIDDSQGERVAQEDIDPALGIGAGVSLRF